MTLRQASTLAKQSDLDDPTGAVFTRDGEIVAGGYSLLPEVLAESGTTLSGLQVAIALSLKMGRSLDRTELFSTDGFDEETAKLLILAGVRKVSTQLPCTDDAIELLEDAGVSVVLKRSTTK